MAVDFNTERIQIENIIAENSERETIVENISVFNEDLIIDKILDFDCKIKEISYQIKDEGIDVRGIVKIDILYMGIDYEDKKTVEYFTYEIKFDNFIMIAESKKGVEAFIDIKLINKDYELMNDNEINVEITIDEFVRLFSYQKINVINHVSGLKENLLKKEKIKLEDIIDNGKSQLNIEAEIKMMDQSNEIIALKLDVVDKKEKIKDNTVEIKGKLSCKIIYKSGNEIKSKQKNIDFSQELCSFLQAGDLNLETELIVRDSSYQFNKQEETVAIEVDLNIIYKLTDLKELNIISDINSERIELEQKEIKLERIIGKDRLEKEVRKNLVLPELKPDIKDIIYEKVRLVPAIDNVEEGGVLIKREASGKVVYSSEEAEDSIYDFINDLEVSTFISIPDTNEGMSSYSLLIIKDISSEVLNARTVEIKFKVEKRVVVKEFKLLNLITDIIEVAPIVYQNEEQRPSFLVYIVKEGDDLEKISKRYKTHSEDIIAENEELEQERLKVGQKILIPKTIVNNI